MAYMLQGRIASKRLNGGALPSDLKECRSQLLPDAAPKVFWVDKCGISEDELRVGKEALEWALRWKVRAADGPKEGGSPPLYMCIALDVCFARVDGECWA